MGIENYNWATNGVELSKLCLQAWHSGARNADGAGAAVAYAQKTYGLSEADAKTMVNKFMH